jgi:hypothetical protein
MKFLQENGYPKRYRDLIDPRATSDDEADPNGAIVKGAKVHYIKRRPERSAKAEKWFRLLDKKREEYTRQDPSKKWRERLRIVPEEQKDSDFRALPQQIPIDYFDPAFYNNLQPLRRLLIACKKIAFLPNVDQSFTRNQDEKLSDDDFMMKYGDAVLMAYELVDENEFDGMEDEIDGDWIVDDDEEMDDDGDDDDEYEEY